jgi:hypothetical protein
MSTDTINKPLLVGMTKAGVLLDCGDDKLYELIEKHELDSFLFDGRRKVTMASIERLIQKRLAAATGEFERAPDMREMRKKRRSHWTKQGPKNMQTIGDKS